MSFSPNAASVYADGPVANPLQPSKPEIRAYLLQLEAATDAIASGAGTIAKQTLAQLNADLAHSADTMAWVYADGNIASNGIYCKNGAAGAGSWSFALPLPYTFIVAGNSGAGTPNAIKATSSVPVTNGMLVSVPIAVANTNSPVTIAFNSQAPLTIKTRSGQDVAQGDLTPGYILGARLGSLFYLLSDTAVASLIYAARDAAFTARDAAQEAQAEAEAARDIAAGYASDAVSQGNVPIYATIDGMSALTVPAGISAIRVNAKSSPDDRLGGFYIDTNNGSTDTFVSGGDTARTWYRSSADRALGRRAFAGTNIYPNDVPGASSRYDPNSSFKANTVGAKNLLLGASAKDGGTWVEAYMPGDDAVGRTLHYAIADGHGYTMVNALRSSDFASSVRDFLITDVTVMVADHQTVAHTLWNRYDHGIITATGLFAQFYNEEKSLQNLAADAGSLDPFTAAVGGDRTRVAVNLHLTSGINAGIPSNLLSAAIDVSANGGRYRRGIVVAADALDTTGGTADAVAMAINHALTWYVSDGAGAGKAVWKMFNNSGSGTLSQIILGANNLWVAAADIAVSSGRKLGLVPDASIGFRFNAGNGHVELVRTDGTVVAFWVV